MLCGGAKCKIKNKEGFGVKCKDMPIETVTEVKYLGVKIDETPSGEGILDTLVKKCTGRIKFLYRQAGCLPTALKMTVPTLVQCQIHYAISSWYAAMTQKTRNELQIAQNKINRFISNLQPEDI